MQDAKILSILSEELIAAQGRITRAVHRFETARYQDDGQLFDEAREALRANRAEAQLLARLINRFKQEALKSDGNPISNDLTEPLCDLGASGAGRPAGWYSA